MNGGAGGADARRPDIAADSGDGVQRRADRLVVAWVAQGREPDPWEQLEAPPSAINVRDGLVDDRCMLVGSRGDLVPSEMALLAH